MTTNLERLLSREPMEEENRFGARIINRTTLTSSVKYSQEKWADEVAEYRQRTVLATLKEAAKLVCCGCRDGCEDWPHDAGFHKYLHTEGSLNSRWTFKCDALPIRNAIAAAGGGESLSDEIDRQVSEALGLKWDESRCRVCGLPLVENGQQKCWKSNCSVGPLLERRADDPAHYSTDITRAIEAIEGFEDWHLQKSPPSCCLKINGVWGDMFNESTLALSICAAILAASKGEK